MPARSRSDRDVPVILGITGDPARVMTFRSEAAEALAQDVGGRRPPWVAS